MNVIGSILFYAAVIIICSVFVLAISGACKEVAFRWRRRRYRHQQVRQIEHLIQYVRTRDEAGDW